MIKSRLFELFDSFSKKEIYQIRKLIASPFFNQRDHVLDLFNYFVRTKFEKKAIPQKEEALKPCFQIRNTMIITPTKHEFTE